MTHDHDASSISGATFRRWYDFIQSEEGGEATLADILKNLSGQSRAALGAGPDESRTYPNEIFEDFCDVTVAVTRSFNIGLRMGEHSAEKSRTLLIPMLESSDGNPLRFMQTHTDTIYRLFNPFGVMGFNAEGVHGGTLTMRGFPHHELLCHQNAGYFKHCLEYLAKSHNVQAGPVLHEADSSETCRIRLRWELVKG